jgi:hypothetical protein
MKKMVFALSLIALSACGNSSKLDETKKPKTNVARDNALVAHTDAKCDEVGFEEPELHSVRCSLKNGVRLYCWAGIAGSDCKVIYVPEEVAKAAQAQQEATQKAQVETKKTK